MRTLINGIIALLVAVGIIGCETKANNDQPIYKNPAAAVNDRVADLMSRMTLEEKVAQMAQYVGPEHMKQAEKDLSPEELHNNDALGFYPGLHHTDIEQMAKEGKVGSFLHVISGEEANYLQELAQQSRLGIPLLIGIDAIHGNGLNYGATIYPTPIGLASTWDETLSYRMGVETAKEMRATGSHWAFTPNIDIARDARWGRVGETFGEDPYLVGNMGVEMIKGFQQDDFTGNEKVIACAKHLIGGGEPMNGTNASPLDISMRTIREVHLPPYRRAVQEADVFSIMTAHNEVNGIPCHNSKELMTDIVRNEYGFNGFYVSDWMDIERIHSLHHQTETMDEAFRQSVNNGMDMHMHGPKFTESIVEGVKSGIVPQERVDEACSKILEVKFRLGLFENPFTDEKKAKEIVFNQEHQATALEIARKSIVLLKNDGILPLKKNAHKKIFLTGPNANNETILGDWHWLQPADRIITVKEGLEAVAKEKGFALDYYNSGEVIGKTTDKAIKEAAARAAKSDLAVVVVGENSLRYKWSEKTCGENTDRAHINLPGRQLELIKAIKKTGTPVIAVLVNGRPIGEEWLENNMNGILETWEPGSFGGQAITEILFGDVNPSAKLPVTVPRTAGQIKLYYNHKPSHYFHKYKFTNKNPLYAFGFGLSYTKFKTSNVAINKTSIKGDGTFTVTADVQNIGKVEGEEIVQVYIRDDYSSVTRPVKELKAYAKVTLKAGEKKSVSFDLTTQDLAFFNQSMDWVVEKGTFTIMVGSSSMDKDLTKLSLEVSETKKLDLNNYKPNYPAAM
ncbi:beta-glucosidase [Flammeovirga sp. MY04]|uniref:glycoside hydrolase family 3 N-terminal domain-containing protein n=1 Tax=Flammeovirga sp. MY04 TaxID=1191459 RepID=UPI00080637EC|nr:glycoside hydrolase family 3 N-terminal domain-containing protein [Flammeovirga sp. MY04]ANQ52493.1 beta-glucosidase [Flammeovirga sp. MY04]